MFERNNAGRVQSSSIKKEFNHRALNSLYFVRLVSKYFRKNLEDQFEVTEHKEKKTESSREVPVSLSTLSESSKNEETENMRVTILIQRRKH